MTIHLVGFITELGCQVFVCFRGDNKSCSLLLLLDFFLLNEKKGETPADFQHSFLFLFLSHLRRGKKRKGS